MQRFFVLIFAISLTTAVPYNAEADSPDSIITAQADQDSAELWAEQSRRAARSQSHRENRPAAATRPQIMRTYIPACEGNTPGADSLGTLCPRAVTLCAATPDPTDLGFWVFTAPVGPAASADWTTTGELVCRGAGNPGDAPAIEPVVTAEDFRRLPLPASQIMIQPPSGRTLVNIPTNLYADSATVTLPTTVLGQPVRVRATPLRFRWSYGDGEVRTTTDPGAPYPELRTAHTYRQPGADKLDLRTTYSGEYSVDGGPWLPIDGLAVVNSPGSTLTVIAAENHLVANPVP
jgi:hypothetical protein